MGGATLGQGGQLTPQLFGEKKNKYVIFLWKKKLYILIRLYEFHIAALARAVLPLPLLLLVPGGCGFEDC